jgi:hypothetical protein
MSVGRELTAFELDVVVLIASEVRTFGKDKAPSYLGLVPAWREIVDAVLGLVDEEDEPPFGEILDSMFGTGQDKGGNHG